MRKRSCIIPALGLLLVAAAWCGADDRSEARAIVERAIRAHGGEEKLTRFLTTTGKGKMTLYEPSGKPAEQVTWHGSFQPPERLYFVTEGKAEGKPYRSILAVDGKEGWMRFNDETRDMTKQQVNQQRNTLYLEWISRLVPLKEPDFTLTPLGEAQVNGRPALGVRVARKPYLNVSLFFDRQTDLLLKASIRLRDEINKKDVDMELLFSGYRDADGVKYASKTMAKWDGKTLYETEVQELKAVDRLDDKLFVKP
jgi:hypothetical protein